jgi:hypothetical protein
LAQVQWHLGHPWLPQQSADWDSAARADQGSLSEHPLPLLSEQQMPLLVAACPEAASLRLVMYCEVWALFLALVWGPRTLHGGCCC